MRMLKFILPLLATAMSLFAVPADAATLKTLHDFCASDDCADGRRPIGIAMDQAGRIYGTTGVGGIGNTGGVAYMLEPQGKGWKFSIIHSFCAEATCPDGGSPQGNLVIDAKGALYGVTQVGGALRRREGTVFRLSPNADRSKWKFKILHSFCDKLCGEGGGPPAGLAYPGQMDGQPYDGVSPLYGVARGGQVAQSCGNAGCGIVYKIYPQTKRKWSFQIIYQFCPQKDACKDGWMPLSKLVAQSPNTLLGTTVNGGETGGGLLFKLTEASGTTTWNHTPLVSFCTSQCADGSFPYASPTLAADGSIYGTTGVGRAPFSGSLWKFATNQQESVLYKFCQAVDCNDGTLPLDTIVTGSGDIYGIAEQGGGHFIDRNGLGGGVVYKFSGGTQTQLWRFCSQLNCTDGEYPVGNILPAPNGKIYGTTTEGGAHGGGTIYELTP